MTDSRVAGTNHGRAAGDPGRGTEHLLLGLLRYQEGVVAQVLTNIGFKLDDARGQIAVILSQNREEFREARLSKFEPSASGRRK